MNNLGNILKERNELVEAEQLLSKAVSIQYVAQNFTIRCPPKTAKCAFSFFFFFSLTDSSSLSYNPCRHDFAAAWMNLGIVQNSLQEFEKAEQSYWNAIRFRKKYPDCYYNLGRLVRGSSVSAVFLETLSKKKKSENKNKFLKKLIKVNTVCYHFFLPMERQYADQNRHVDALNAWRNATMLKPDHSLAWNNMVILLDNTGNTHTCT